MLVVRRNVRNAEALSSAFDRRREKVAVIAPVPELDQLCAQALEVLIVTQERLPFVGSHASIVQDTCCSGRRV